MAAATPTHRILVADSISDAGVELLRATPGFEVTVATGLAPAELRQRLQEHDALIVRSATKVTAEVLDGHSRLQAIGRAGTGVDNIDLAAATRAGIVVMNTPGGNSVAAAELTMTLLLALARHVPQANADLRGGRWERKKYMGVEVAGKTLGVVGLGRIGREVSRMAQAFRMETVGFDPYVSAQMAADFGVRCLPLEEVIALADFLTLHVPVSDETRHLLNRETLARMKPGARVINCARGELVDEPALLAALESGHIGGAALDVFEQEPPSDRRLVEHPRVISTPHLGASTQEAQERVGTEIAQKVRDYFSSGVILDAVNFPAINRKEYESLGPLMHLAEKLASFLGQIVDGGPRTLEVRALGSFAERPLRPIVMAAARGLLAPVLEGGVSYVNALNLAGERGIRVEEARSNEATPFAGLLRLTLSTDRGRATVAGTLYDPARPRLVEVDGVSIESFPLGHSLFFRNRDVPGVVGQIGTILGRAGVNIAGFQLGRSSGGDQAVSIIDVDGPVPESALREIRAVPEVLEARAVRV